MEILVGAITAAAIACEIIALVLVCQLVIVYHTEETGNQKKIFVEGFSSLGLLLLIVAMVVSKLGGVI